MFDGGFNVDNHIKKRKDVINIHSPIFNKMGRYFVSFPDIEEGDNVEYVKRPGESTDSKNIKSDSSKYLWNAVKLKKKVVKTI